MILIVEDQIELQRSIAKGLRLSGYEVDVCGDGNIALDMMIDNPYQLVILDLNLPGLGGLEIQKEIRNDNKELKILILSARAGVEDKVKGLNLGANDYLAKPFDFIELEARVNNLIRQKYVYQDSVLLFKDYQLNTQQRSLTYQGKEISLTRKELAIFEYLLQNINRVITPQELLDNTWDGHSDLFNTSVRVHISTLRKKIRNVSLEDPISTVIGEGYMIKEDIC